MNIKESIVVNNVQDYDVYLEIMLTTHCNINCDYCCKGINQIPAQDRKHIDIDVFAKSIEQLFSFNKNIKYLITLIGGEITLHPHIDQIIKILANYEDQISELSMLFNGKLDFKKYIDIFPPEKLNIGVTIHRRMISNSVFDTTIQNIINGYKKINNFAVYIMTDPVISEEIEFWKNILQKISQQLQHLSNISIVTHTLNGYTYNTQMTDYIYTKEKQQVSRMWQITDQHNNVITAFRSDIKAGRIKFEGLYCYSYNLSWFVNIDGNISRYCDQHHDSYALDKYNNFFTMLINTTPCIKLRCGCGPLSRTKKTTDKHEVEEFYKKILTK